MRSVVGAFVCLCLCAAVATAAEDRLDFNRDVRPILSDRCFACHGPDARGGLHVMHMQTMDAPDIRWSALAAHKEGEEAHEDEHGEYGLEAFRLAVVEGRHPDGEPLDDDMPRWRIDDQGLADLAEYLQSLP